jgi:hypothetical protein
MPAQNKLVGPDFDKLKQEVDSKFPAGRFVAVQAGRVIVDADTHRNLVERLRSRD